MREPGTEDDMRGAGFGHCAPTDAVSKRAQLKKRPRPEIGGAGRSRLCDGGPVGCTHARKVLP
jgi:hypothetical protein